MPFLLLIFFLSCATVLPQEFRLPSDWKFYQELPIERAGFLKLALPPETMNAARPALEDLRVYNVAGEEIPFFLETPEPLRSGHISIPHFTTQVEPNQTVIQFETGTNNRVDSLGLDTPAQQFLKAVTVAASNDGSAWQTLVQSRPIFRRGRSSLLEISLPPGIWKVLRVIVDDRRDSPIPFQNFSLRTTPPDPNPPRALNTRLIGRQESGHESRVTLDLGAANLYLAKIEITTPEPFFTRTVSLLVSKIQGNELVEEEIGSGQISRIQLEGATASDNRTIAVNKQIASQQIIVVFRNQDAPPLKIEEIHAWTLPFTAAFYMQASGRAFVLTGNSRSSAPRYDLNFVRSELAKIPISDSTLGPVTPNPSYKEPPTLPGIAETGAKIDLSGWKYRKAILVSVNGPQELELDLETLSFSDSTLRDLRVVQNDSQLPYLIERTSALKEFSPQWNFMNDRTRASVSRWQIVLPYQSLPIKRLTCQAPNSLFQRTMSIYDNRSASRGDNDLALIGQAIWTRKPDQTQSALSIDLSQPPLSNLLLLETDNGDNPPISITNVKLAYPVTRLLFKANSTSGIYLYLGNSDAAFPRYDLAIVSEQLLKANKTIASLGKLEELKHALNLANTHTPILFWAVLALVVLGLLFVISRLLPPPKTQF
jgi:hypothetical protein